MFRQLYYLALIGIPVAAVGVAVWWDLRTRRGYGVTLLATLLLAAIVSFAIAFEREIQQAPSSEQFGIGIVEVVYFMIGCYLALILWIGALVEAGTARQWRWLVGLVAAALLPGLLILADVLLDFGALRLEVMRVMRDIELVLIILLPTAMVLAYGIARVARKAPPAAAPPGQQRAV